MSQKSLEDVINAAGSPVQLLRNSQTGPYIYPVVPPEFSNWRDEQRAWRDTCILFNQSYHMTDMYMEGPDALKVLSMLGVNSFKNFGPSKAKQFVACNYDGYVIGDVILFHLEQNRFNLVGRPSVHNWVQYHCETGGYDVKLDRDERTVARPGPIVRKVVPLSGPGPERAQGDREGHGQDGARREVLQHDGLSRSPVERVRALRHGMVGQPGFELFGPWEDGDAVKAAIVEAGQEFGLRQSGARTYSSNTLESGWIPSPLPAIYTGDKMKAYRQWLPANTYEAIASLGGSFYSNNIQDYYLTPWDLGYGPSVKFDHDFIGREALEKIAAKPRRKKVTLVLNSEDVTRGIVNDVPAGAADEVLRLPVCRLLDAAVRQGREGRQGGWRIDVVWLQLQRRSDAHAGHPRRRAQRARHAGDVRVGRRRRRVVEADGRASRAARDSRDGRAGAIQRSGANVVSRGLKSCEGV